MERFFGANNVTFSLLPDGDFKVVLGPDALQHLLVDYSNRPGTNRDYIVALAQAAQSNHGVMLGEFNVQFTKNAQAMTPPVPQPRIDHPTMGPLIVKDGALAPAHPIVPPTHGVIEALVTSYASFGACFAFWSVFGFADDVAVAGFAGLSRRVRRWAASAAGRRILARLGLARASVATLYGVMKCHHHVTDPRVESPDPGKLQEGISGPCR